MADPAPILQIQKLTVTAGTRALVRDVDLAIGAEMRGIVGDLAVDADAGEVDAGSGEALAEAGEDLVVIEAGGAEDESRVGHGREQRRPSGQRRIGELVEVVEAAEGDVA